MECIKILTDEEFGIKPIEFNNPIIRIGARGIIINKDGKLAIFNKVNKNEYKLPGGGMEERETPEEAFKREAMEETGCEIEIIKDLGTIEEYRSQNNFKQISYVFVAKVIKDTHKLNLTEKEKDEGARLLWVEEQEALQLVKNCINNIKASNYENVYHTKFMVKRDAYILEKYLREKIDKNMEKNILLIGLGPHSKRIYMNYFKKYKIEPKILIDLKSNEENVKNYLVENNFNNTIIWTIPDEYKDYEELPKEIYEELKKLCEQYKIKYIISSTEPKAHNMYLKFALENNINILSDKPITVVKGMDKLENVQKVKQQYLELVELKKKSTAKCNIMCQRQYHKGYLYIKSLLSEIISKYNIPITYIDVYHCDGCWEMPHDIDKENHPYKYGYGKLYHSGYHFIDLLAEFLKLNKLTTENKRITSGKMYAEAFTVKDENALITQQDYKKLFGTSELEKIYSDLDSIDYNKYGEKNFYGNLSFYNNDNRLITVANLNLLYFGFSRRGWLKSRDYYKKNGRVRHERLNIQVGPLLNIQVHSYQSKQVEDRQNNEYEIMTGGLEHFDIDIYRNVDLIGGKPFERIKLKDLYVGEAENQNFIGYNELSREEFITEFLNGTASKGDLEGQKLAMEMLYTATKILYNKKQGESQLEQFDTPKDFFESSGPIDF